MLAGAAIAKALPRARFALPLAFASHFLLDYTPHLDSHALFGAPVGPPTRLEVTMTLADVVLGVALVLWAVAGQQARRLMLAAAFAAVAIDLFDNVPPWSAWFRAWPATAWLSHFHHGFQHNLSPAQWPLGFATQLALVAFALWAIRARKEISLCRTEPVSHTAPR
jgi:hypothetical protein